jgi:glutaryl-CoA dehydrogenase
MEKFRGVDYYGIEGLLSDEERAIRDAVRDWVESEFLPVIAEHHRVGTFPVKLIPKLGELGVFGATLKGYGCAGLNNVAYGLIMQELERGDSGLRSAASVQSGLVMYPIYAYGSDAQKDRWLPKLATGEKVGCFGLTEPDHGSDPGSMKTRARKTADGYVLNGTKLWITNGSIADVAVVWAKEDDGRSTATWSRRARRASRRSTSTASSRCGPRSPPSCLSRTAGSRREQAAQGEGAARSARLPEPGALRDRVGRGGRAMACYDWALQYAQQRIQFGKPIASFQLVQQKLVWMITEITKAQLLVLQLGRPEGRRHAAARSRSRWPR